jgi:hypothetical protein
MIHRALRRDFFSNMYYKKYFNMWMRFDCLGKLKIISDIIVYKDSEIVARLAPQNMSIADVTVKKECS